MRKPANHNPNYHMKTIDEAQFEKQDLSVDDGENGYDNGIIDEEMTEEDKYEFAREIHIKYDLCRKEWDSWCDCGKCLNGVEQAIEDSRKR